MIETPTPETEHTTPVVKRSLSRVVSQRLVVLIVIITSLVSVTSYYYSVVLAEKQVREQLLRFCKKIW